MPELLKVENLKVQFQTSAGPVTAVNNLNFGIDQGKILGIVGESGSGKSVSMNAIMGLIRDKNASISGSVHYQGKNLIELSDDEMRGIRGKEIAMIFQDPMTALTPVYTVGWHIIEQIRFHSDISKSAAKKRAIEILDEVGIPDPVTRVDQYPHEYSGGMRQRAIIAMALALNPLLLIADEPTTALDVTIQAQILDLLKKLQRQYGSAIIIITHDMGVVSEIADEVLVMYAGTMVERGSKSQIFKSAAHPYTKGLMNSVPRIDKPRTKRLEVISGQPASLLNLPSGCAFRTRCTLATPECERPQTIRVADPDHFAACHLVGSK